MKRLMKIRLINWHYFSNETIEIKGSFLLTGENKAGKSTIIDAVQYVLTANNKLFNKAANENSRRDLKGYVRCKTGTEGQNYKYKSSDNIIAYVALEFYDDRTNKNFVIGIKVDSPDENVSPSVKWFIEDGCLENISFLTGNRPSVDNELKMLDKKISLISQQREAKSRIMHRLGNINERFFSILPQSIAFKPLNNVKEFIYQYILEEHDIDVAPLQSSIRSLNELEDLMEEVERRIAQLDEILKVKEDIESNDIDALTNDIMLLLAQVETKGYDISNMKVSVQRKTSEITGAKEQLETVKALYTSKNTELADLKVAQSTGECALLVKECENVLSRAKEKLEEAREKFNKIKDAVKKVSSAQRDLMKIEIKADSLNAEALLNSDTKTSACIDTVNNIKTSVTSLINEYQPIKYTAEIEEKSFQAKIEKLEKEIRQLKNNKISYPEDTIKLKKAIEEEFARASIRSHVYIFCDLLEINDAEWQNAVEGYLNTQRFYIIVEPRYYDTAARVYDRIKKTVSGVGLVNTAKISSEEDVPEDSLALKVTSQNIYAKQYVKFLLGRVHCCSNVDELKVHSVAITAGCMIYQNHSLRKIPERVYAIPYIGAYAVKRQLELKTEELAKVRVARDENKKKLLQAVSAVNILLGIPLYAMEENAGAASNYRSAHAAIESAESRLKEAKADPTYIELGFKIDSVTNELQELDSQKTKLVSTISFTNAEINQIQTALKSADTELSQMENSLSDYENQSISAYSLAKQKYELNRKDKSPEAIFNNFSRKRSEYINKRVQYESALGNLQMQYDGGSLGKGVDALDRYVQERDKLVRSELTKYESQLKETKTNCNDILRQSFLAQIGEQITRAQAAFNALNRSLSGIWYGEDSYYFLIRKNKQKAALYDMFMSEDNIKHEEATLFSNAFESEYEQQIQELFDKLTLKDDADQKVLKEYTDYRSYLDFDVRITNKQGETRLFSKVSGDMSGGEAQTPYYVAIAASFSQIYNSDTIKLVILDEAFDKMDDDRSESMMKFFKSMGFQIILGSPFPGKLDAVEPYVDDIFLVFRADECSLVQRYRKNE